MLISDCRAISSSSQRIGLYKRMSSAYNKIFEVDDKDREVIGPLLFSIYIDPITSLSLSSTSKILLYADDILLYKPILCEEDEIALQSDINIIINWINDASLKLNASKTKLLLVSRQKLPPTLSLLVNQEQIQQVDSVYFSWVYFTGFLVRLLPLP